ncbi:unnamed protein product [Rotaria sp. Silwood2]|nr:unnamed protein product [Rotaria sp. Silwood2]CAF2582365.1 unnamed protein product [Rotaria sp. Silwood2]
MSETAAIELLKRAVQLDGEEKYSDALTCYSEGVRMLLNSVKAIPSSDERKRAAYRQKITECIDRAEKLKDLIQQEKDLCVPSLFTICCSNNYTVIVRTASHNVAQILGSCSYTSSDFIVEGINIITCLNDSNQCSIYVTKTEIISM